MTASLAQFPRYTTLHFMNLRNTQYRDRHIYKDIIIVDFRILIWLSRTTMFFIDVCDQKLWEQIWSEMQALRSATSYTMATTTLLHITMHAEC